MDPIKMSDVLQMSVPERVRLVQAIWDSVEAEPEAIPLTAAERQELDRRWQAFQREPEIGFTWAEVKAELLNQN
jgi:putative addiction module component (TIGR02574 family)